MMDSLKLFGKHLRKLRKARGFTQEAFAEKCGLYYPHIGAIERGQKNISFLTMEKIAAGLEISLSELVAVPELEKTEKGKIIAMISEANQSNQKHLLKGIQYIIKSLHVD